MRRSVHTRLPRSGGEFVDVKGVTFSHAACPNASPCPIDHTVTVAAQIPFQQIRFIVKSFEWAKEMFGIVRCTNPAPFVHERIRWFLLVAGRFQPQSVLETFAGNFHAFPSKCRTVPA